MIWNTKPDICWGDEIDTLGKEFHVQILSNSGIYEKLTDAKVGYIEIPSR